MQHAQTFALMTYLHDSPPQDIRRRALEKIASLSATSSYDQSEGPDFKKLYSTCSRTRDGQRGAASPLPNGASNGNISLSTAPMVQLLNGTIKE